jgi:hypothetical protein
MKRMLVESNDTKSVLFRGGCMRTKTLGMSLALCFVAAAVCFASPQMGTWKLNEAKSKLVAGTPKNSTVIYEAAGDSVKIIVEGTDAAGKPARNEWTGKFDGKSYPVTGDPASDARVYTTVDDNTLDLTVSKAGKVTVTGHIVVSADGKTRTVTLTGTDAQGKPVTSVAVYDKQ